MSTKNIMATITEIRQINQAIAALTINKLISDRHDLHTDIKIELYRSGMAYRAIADLFTANGIKTTHQTVAKVVTRAGISRAHAVRKNQAPVNSKVLGKESQIIALRKQGLTVKAIASQSGISQPSVSKVLKLNGLDTKQLLRDRYANHIDTLTPKIIELRSQGMILEAIAKELKTTVQTVQKILKAIGVK
jgi:DNA-binding NarL/FixJ family response regulator